MITARLKNQIAVYAGFLLFASIAMVSASCVNNGSPEERINAIVMSSPNCQAPCWNGLQPGQSATDEFLSVVENASGENFRDLEFRSSAVWSGYQWTDSSSGFSISMEVTNERVRQIGFQPRNDLPLEAVVGTIGSPQSYVAVYSWGEREFVTILLFYTDVGVIVKSRVLWHDIDTIDCGFEIDGSMQVREIYLTQPKSPETLLNEHEQFSAFAQYKPFPWQQNNVLSVQRCP
jgi:hypothetical protein